MTLAESGRIFISYRRHESRHLAGRLYDRLVERFGEGQVFIDVDTIAPGVDFAEEISRAVATCKVLLAVIDPNWLTATNEQGGRRLDDPDDIVRLEIEAALARDVRVIPILMEGAVMPGRHDLPESLAGLARRNALLIRYETFRYDAGRLVTAIEQVLAAAPGTAAVSGSPAAQAVRPVRNAGSEVAEKDSGTARNDPGRAARLLTEAERTANTITDNYTKALALRGVAEALAATDPDHAARLLTEAERTANTIADNYKKAASLRHVAEALAATDPEPGDQDRCRALARLARRCHLSFCGHTATTSPLRQ
jgi:TIR domain